jgi:hypothetical protein
MAALVQLRAQPRRLGAKAGRLGALAVMRGAERGPTLAF